MAASKLYNRMRLFDIDSTNRVIIDPEIRLIPAFKRIIIRDKDREKKLAMKELAFIYFFCDYKSPIATFKEEDRRKEALLSAGLSEQHKIDVDIEHGIHEYLYRRDTMPIQLLKSAYKTIEKAKDFLDNIDFTARNNRGDLEYSLKETMASIAGLGKLMAGLKELEDQVKKEETGDDRVRGGGKKGLFEDPEEDYE
jgi:hypothetical protein